MSTDVLTRQTLHRILFDRLLPVLLWQEMQVRLITIGPICIKVLKTPIHCWPVRKRQSLTMKTNVRKLKDWHVSIVLIVITVWGISMGIYRSSQKKSPGHVMIFIQRSVKQSCGIWKTIWTVRLLIWKTTFISVLWLRLRLITYWQRSILHWANLTMQSNQPITSLMTECTI